MCFLNLCSTQGVRLMELGLLPAHNMNFHAIPSSAVAAVPTSAGYVQECKLETCSAFGAVLIAVVLMSSLCNCVALGSFCTAFCCWNPLGFGSAAYKVTSLSLQLRLAWLFVAELELCMKSRDSSCLSLSSPRPNLSCAPSAKAGVPSCLVALALNVDKC